MLHVTNNNLVCIYPHAGFSWSINQRDLVEGLIMSLKTKAYIFVDLGGVCHETNPYFFTFFTLCSWIAFIHPY